MNKDAIKEWIFQQFTTNAGMLYEMLNGYRQEYAGQFAIVAKVFNVIDQAFGRKFFPDKKRMFGLEKNFIRPNGVWLVHEAMRQ